jgi:hypothetical protein
MTAAALVLFALGFCLLTGVRAAAEEEDATPQVSQTRAVRLTGVEGTVKVVQDDQTIADPATDNLPLFEGSQITTGNDGRGEVQLEDGSIARLSPNTELTFSLLQRQGTGTRTEIVVNRGLAYFELQPVTPEHSLKVTYGAASFTASSFTVVRVNLDAAPGAMAVFSGNVHLEGGSAPPVDLHGGQSLSFSATDPAKYDVNETIEQDSWDSWNADRDQELTTESAGRTAATGEYMDGDTAGMNSLDANGNWYNVPGQGYVWSPYEAIANGDGFDPYGYGRWVLYPRYGYVWVSGYQWGYAPYQCGMWNYYDSFGWGWAPGGGGCSPWYDNDLGGWGYNLGGYPVGYLPPRRPLRPIRPGGPRPVGPHPIGPHPGHGLAQPPSVIAIDRRPTGPVHEPGREPGGNRVSEPVTIAGYTVQPLHPITARPVYDRNGASGFVTGGSVSRGFAGGYNGGTHPIYPGAHPGGVPVHVGGYSAPGAHPAGGYSGGARPSGGGGGHASAPSGGGGGGGHPSGGGGGGGGGSHK